MTDEQMKRYVDLIMQQFEESANIDYVGGRNEVINHLYAIMYIIEKELE